MANQAHNDVSAHRIGVGGALDADTSFAFPSGAQPFFVAISPQAFTLGPTGARRLHFGPRGMATDLRREIQTGNVVAVIGVGVSISATKNQCTTALTGAGHSKP